MHFFCFILRFAWRKLHSFVEGDLNEKKSSDQLIHFLVIFLFIQAISILPYNNSAIYYESLKIIPYGFYLVTMPITLLFIYFLIRSFFNIRKISYFKSKYYSILTTFWLITFFETAFTSSILFEMLNLSFLEPFPSLLLMVPFILLIYSFTRYSMCKYLIGWKTYALSFIFLLPFPCALAAGALLEPLKSFAGTGPNSDLMDYLIIICMIILFNFIILKAPKENLPAVKVAVYLTLAIFSTFSYCTFLITDWLSNYILEQNVDPSIKITEEDLKRLQDRIDSFFKYLFMPYLIGTFFACFTLEYKEFKFKQVEKTMDTKSSKNQLSS